VCILYIYQNVGKVRRAFQPGRGKMACRAARGGTLDHWGLVPSGCLELQRKRKATESEGVPGSFARFRRERWVGVSTATVSILNRMRSEAVRHHGAVTDPKHHICHDAAQTDSESFCFVVSLTVNDCIALHSEPPGAPSPSSAPTLSWPGSHSGTRRDGASQPRNNESTSGS
jgi:hypothetical protein